MAENPCPTCNGYRLNKEALAVLIGGKNIGDVVKLSITEAYQFFNSLDLSKR